MASLRTRYRKARKRYIGNPSNERLRTFLRLKARLGRWDARYCAYYNVPVPTNLLVKAYITRGFARGLVPTATTNGTHAPGSLHYSGRAADMGVRSNEVGTSTQTRRLANFHSAEYARARKGIYYAELIGPHNDKIILRGNFTSLPEGSDLEQAHDNHVHGAF